MDKLANEPSDSARKLLNAGSAYRHVDPKAAIASIEEAVEILLRGGRFDAAANNEKEIASIYEEVLHEEKGAMVFYQRAADRYSGENSNAMAQGCLLKVAAIAASTSDYARASSIYESAALAAVPDSLRKYSVRDFLLKAGLCRIAMDDKIGARRAIDGYPGIDASFLATRECKFLTDLLAAVEEQNEEEFSTLVETFDRTNALDDWKTRLLLVIKEALVQQESDLT